MIRAIAALVLTVLLAGSSTAAAAQAVHDDAAVPLSDAELSGLRGGWLTAAGVAFNFGVVMRTFVEDRLTLETRLTWTPDGPVTERWSDPQHGVALGDVIDSLAAEGVNLDGLARLDGLVLDGDGGATVVLHALGEGAIQNLVLNTADNRSIRQDTQIDLAIQDLPGLQRTISVQRLGGEIGREIGALTAAGR